MDVIRRISSVGQGHELPLSADVLAQEAANVPVGPRMVYDLRTPSFGAIEEASEPMDKPRAGALLFDVVSDMRKTTTPTLVRSSAMRSRPFFRLVPRSS